jgi:ribosome-binding protein aMBF1 (putative translation factor)
MRCQVAHDHHIRVQKQTTVARQQLPLHPVHTLVVGARVPDVFAQVRHVFVDVVTSERNNAELSSTMFANRLQTQVQMLRSFPLVLCELVVQP